MVRIPSRMVRIDDKVSLSVFEVAGSGHPFLLIHGLASNARLWDGVVAALTGQRRATIAVDLRGHGLSAKVDDGYDFATISADLVEVARSAAGGRVIAVGQSWGGNVVLELAARHPEVVAGLVLVDGGFIRLADQFPTLEAALTNLAPPNFDGLSRDQLERHLTQRFQGWPETAVGGALANFEIGVDDAVRPRLSLDRHLKILEQLWHHDPDVSMRRVAVPTLVLAAENGHPGKRERVEAFSRSLGRGRIVWMEGEHDLHAQHPDAVSELLIDLAGEVERTRS